MTGRPRARFVALPTVAGGTGGRAERRGTCNAEPAAQLTAVEAGATFLLEHYDVSDT
jgi:hypothetical protein